MRLISISFTRNWFDFDSDSKCKSFANKSWYSNSQAEPIDILRKWAKSDFDFRPLPSAIFVGIEAADLLIWLVIPYFSLSGNFEVSLYTNKTNSCDFFQALIFLKSCISTIQTFLVTKFYSILFNETSIKRITYDFFWTNELKTGNCLL